MSTGGLVSVVVPHGGRERLPLLRCCLASLRQHPEVGQVIVAEMRPEPEAREVARRWADHYVLIREDGPFERARALNVGSALAECDLVLWLDNDLLLPPGFISHAVRELHERGLDYLVPYTRIHYLSECDSRSVIAGASSASDMRAVSVFHSGERGPRVAGGGIGLARRPFLRRVGGFVEGFRGWGGEDNAWYWKATLLGHTAATARNDQNAWHLFHPGSGGYHTGNLNELNPHYTDNVALMRSVFAMRDAEQFLRHFPPPEYASCAWPREARILFVADPGETAWLELAKTLADGLRGEFGASIEQVTTEDGLLREKLEASDAVMFFGPLALTRGLASAALPEIRTHAAAVLEARAVREADPPELKQAGIALVSVPPPGEAEIEKLGNRVVEALSLIVRRPMRAREQVQVDAGGPALVAAGDPALAPGGPALPPVWIYWEGPLPEWIAACHQTIAAHSPELCLVTPESFARLRESDLDVDISHLSIAHRADYIRAYLLTHFGGLWIDSDCVVMQSLRPVLERVAAHDFVAHRERSGAVSNGFIGARAGSPLAAEFYQRICSVLRSGAPRGWTSLGSEPLTEILDRSPGRWHELRCEDIQPVCWSQPHVFFDRRPDTEHAAHLVPAATCYMMSKTEMEKDARFHPARLGDPRTFHSFLIRKSLSVSEPNDLPARAGSGPAVAPPNPPHSGLADAFRAMTGLYRSYGDESLSGPGSSLVSTEELRSRLPLLIEDLGVRSMLDAPCGDFNWMSHVRLGIEEYTGVDLLDDVIARNRLRYGRPGRRFRRLDLTRDDLPAADLILSRDLLVHLSFAECAQVLRNFRRTGARFLLTTNFPAVQENHDTANGVWRPLNLLSAPFSFPEPTRIIVEKCTEGGGAYADKSLGLWELAALPL